MSSTPDTPSGDPRLPRGRFEDGRAPKVLIVVASGPQTVTDALFQGARAEAEAWGASHETVEVPSALEAAPAIAMARAAGFDAFVALGCAVRGATTPRFEALGGESAHAITLLGMGGTCVGHCILAAETIEEAEAWADPEGHDAGGRAAAAALHLLQLSRRWQRPEKGMGFLRERLGGGDAS